MTRLCPLLLLCAACAHHAEPGAPVVAPITHAAPTDLPSPAVKWKAEIGLTTYRSTIHPRGTEVVVNSNGRDWKSEADPLDGVWTLEARTGRVLSQFVPPGTGEKDANGIAFDGQAMVFGTDQERVYKVMRSQVLWTAELPGDPEAAPALADFNRDGVLDVAIGAEDHDLYALDGRDGHVLYTIPTGSGSYGQQGFLATAALFDVTGDGIKDIFAPGRDNIMHVVDGAAGRPLWSDTFDYALHGSPLITDTDRDGRVEVIYTAAYSLIVVADAATGERKWEVTLEHPEGGIEGLFSPVGWHPGLQCVLVGTAWWDEKESLYCVGAEGVKWRFEEPAGNITSGVVIGEVDGRPGPEVVFGSESGRVYALNLQGQAVWAFQADGPVECTPTLVDVDGDGLTEVLVADNSGHIQALATPGRAPAMLGYYRGSPMNDGVVFLR